jgi:diguanylate cyclase (GGDEF)-like protein
VLFDEEIYRAERTSRPLALVLIDLDGLKLINDDHGHAAGDVALKRVADVLRANRRTDRCARLGGDEFAVLLPDTDARAARAVAQRLCAAIRAGAQLDYAVTLSLGIAAMPGDGTTAEDLHHAADSALYAAKRRGGDQVVHTDALDDLCGTDRT